MPISRVAKLAVPAGLALLLTSGGGNAATPPDTIYLNGKVVTVDANFSIARAFAVSDGKFAAVGTNVDIRALAGPDTRVIDLKGREVLPGLIDAHPHTLIGHPRERALEEVSLLDAKSVAEIVARIATAAAAARPGQWLVTTAIGDPPDYFDLPQSLAEHRWPTRADLDRASPRNPVYIASQRWPYPGILNSQALAALAVIRATPDGDGIRIHHDATGEPNGLIDGLDIYNRDSPLYRKLTALLPKASEEVQSKIVQGAMADDNAEGLTSLVEAHGIRDAVVNRLIRLNSQGLLKTRFALGYEVPSQESLEAIDTWMAGVKKTQEAIGDGDMIRVIGVNVTIDGATQFGKALYNEPYLDPFGQPAKGTQEVTEEKLIAIARLALKHDLRLSILAAGSRACDMAVEAMEAVNRETPIKGKRWFMEHFQQPSRADIAKLKDMGVLVQTYTSADFSKGAEVYVKWFPGQDVWKTVVPSRWYWDAGVPVAQSTDGAHYQTMWTLWDSLVRVDGRTGKSLMTPAKRITREEAIKMYTINGAMIMGMDNAVGSIEPGKLADFAVIDRDILTVPVNDIRDAKVLETALGGKIVYDAAPPAP